MKRKREKWKTKIATTMICIFTVLMNVNSAFAVGFNNGKAQQLVKSYTDPLLLFLLWVIPIGGIIAILWVVVSFLISKDNEEKEQIRPGRAIKRIVFWALFATSIVAILSIVGL